MGLFDGPTKTFAQKLVAALEERSSARQQVATAAKNSNDATVHLAVAHSLSDLSLIIRKVAELDG